LINCSRCNKPLDKAAQAGGFTTHPSCEQVFGDPVGQDPFSAALKQELTDIILWAENNSPRSLQMAVGPSELGDPCDRRLAYRIAGIQTFNNLMDPWPAIVGTAIHSWTEESVNRYMNTTGTRDWLTEVGLRPDPMVKGRSDLYKISTGTVVDLKTAGTDVFRKIKKIGPPEGYKVQVQIYGLGHVRAGRPVNNVALVFVPRAGWISDMYVWQEPYKEEVALAALARLYDLGGRLIEMDIENNGHRYQQIDPVPGDGCAYCPFFVRASEPDVGASQLGCPGR
jgi:hypothetical protein